MKLYLSLIITPSIHKFRKGFTSTDFREFSYAKVSFSSIALVT